jgi:putative aldouronate transport system permease protein
MSRYAANRPVWMERPTLLVRVLKVVTILAVLTLVLFPFLVVISTSLSSEAAISRAGGLVVFPTEISFDAYREIVSGGVVGRALLVSIGVTVIGTTLSLGATILAAYGLSQRGSFAHRGILTFVLLTLLFTPGIIPTYLAVKQYGLLDSYGALILPTAINAFNLIIVRNFFMSVPKELLDAARIDGATDWRILRTIMIPLSKAVIAVVGMFYAVAYWNSFFNALLYMADEAKWPLQLILRIFVLQGQAIEVTGDVPPPQQALQMAIVVLAILPIILAFPFVQRHFTKGVVVGAVKG